MDVSPKFPEHEHLKCPRCESSNTKFCYYNNYNLSQPRHFCKNCRRYWTKGGTLRNIPVGGGTRKITKRSSNKRTSPSPATTTAIAPPPPPPPLQPSVQADQQPKPKAEQSYGFGGAQQTELGDGSFSSMLLRSSSSSTPPSMAMGAFGDLLMDGLSFNNLLHKSDDDDVLIRNRNPVADEFRSSFLRLNDDNNNNINSNQKENGNGNGGEINGWPDLSIFTPGSSSFH